MNKIKLLFTDLDATFLDDNKNVPEANRLAVKEMLEQGHKVIIATGRSLSSALLQAKRLQLDKPGCYCIAYNGGQIYDFGTEKLIYHKTVPVRCAKEAYRICKKYGVHIHTYDATHVLTPEENESVKKYCSLVHVPYKVVPELFEDLDFEPSKVLMSDFDKTGILKTVQREVDAACKGEVDTFFSCEEYLEMVRHGVSKGAAVQFLCEYLQVDLKDTVACGDAENDIPMIETAGVGVCMCNGDPKVKEKADYITTRNNNDGGVAEAIRKFILE